jgi:lysozyme
LNRARLGRDLTLDEGRRTKLYTCTAGKLSIGIGRNIQDNGLSQDEIDYLFNNDVERVKTEMDRHYPWYTNLNDVRQNVLFNMLFNMGVTKLNKFTKTLRNMKEGNYKLAAIEMKNSLWYRQVGNRAKRLVREMETGKWE